MVKRQSGLAVVALVAAGLALPVAAIGYQEGEVTDSGSLTGSVKFVGVPPRIEPLPVKKDREVCGEKTAPEVLVVGPSGGVGGAVILIEGVARGKKPDREIVLDNAKCRFVPHVSVVMRGGSIKVRNSDPVLHDSHGLWDGKITAFNVALPGRGRDVPITRYLKKPGVIEVRCDAHTHMRAWLVVHDSPYFAVTDREGHFKIDGLPPGTYTVAMWHPGFAQKGIDKDGRPIYDEPRRVTRELTIPPRGTAVANFELR